MAPRTLLVLAIGLGLSLPVVAQHKHGMPLPYAGMQNRTIKSLSDSDIEELKRGGGWGLALPAELNGMPGPAHLLDLGSQIPLETAQIPRIEALVDEMRKAAIPAGARLVEAETAIEAAFASGSIDEKSLRQLLADAESARTELRFIHLSQHYKATKLLRPEQIRRYNVLRGYTEDPCRHIPAGHNPEMYRHHMGCN